MTGADVLGLQSAVEEVYVDDLILRWTVELVRATREVHVDVETHGELTRGFSSIDELGITGKPANCTLVTDFDTQGFLELFLGVIG